MPRVAPPIEHMLTMSASDEDFMRLALAEGRKALVSRGVKRAVVAMQDPDTRNAGAGIEILKAAGVDVSIGILEHSAMSDMGAYLAEGANIAARGDCA